MSCKIVSGVPGSGKTLYATYICKKHFKKENSLLVKFFRLIKLNVSNGFIFIFNIFRRLFHKELLKYKVNVYKKYIYDSHHKVNNIYTNFPVLLYTYYDKKTKSFENVYSHSVSLWDLDNSYSFYPYSLIIIDEVQLYIDSDEYIDKTSRENFRPIAKFLQAHRHFGVKDIYFISQHPNRVMAKIRNVTNEFMKIKHFIKIPFLPIGFYSGIIYYDTDSYGKSIKMDKKFINFDFKKFFGICNIKSLYNSYDTCYLRLLNYNKSLKQSLFNSKFLSKEDFSNVFKQR